jgi:ATP-binding protein involved in chromosome partitioning
MSCLRIMKTAYFTPEELPENKYYIFKKAQEIFRRSWCCLSWEVPIVQSIREAGEAVRPAMQEGSVIQTVLRNH